MKFDVIYADPPWRYSFSRSKSRKIENHYPTMPTADICQLPVRRLAAKDSVLALWVPATKLDEGIDVMRAWGAKLLTSAAWDKIKVGMGYWLRGRHETLMICAWGKPKPPPPNVRQHSLQAEKRGRHSAKPTCFRNLIELYDPRRIEAKEPVRRLELFARTAPEGWLAVGNEIDGDDVRASIERLIEEPATDRP